MGGARGLGAVRDPRGALRARRLLLERLGPPVAGEPPDVVAKRAELAERIAELETQVVEQVTLGERADLA